jgi:hypothetical protein
MMLQTVLKSDSKIYPFRLTGLPPSPGIEGYACTSTLAQPSGLVVSISGNMMSTVRPSNKHTHHLLFVIQYFFSFNSYCTSMALATLHQDSVG